MHGCASTPCKYENNLLMHKSSPSPTFFPQLEARAGSADAAIATVSTS